MIFTCLLPHPRRRTKRKVADINKALTIAVKTGKVSFGANNALKSAKAGKVRLIVVASNCPEEIQKDIKYHCKFSKVPLFLYNGASLELGRACGKPFLVSALSIRDPGDSDILKLVAERNV